LGVPFDYKGRAFRSKSSPITAVGFPLQSLTVASKYYLNYTGDFIRETKSISKEDINKWLNDVAYDLYADSKNGTKDLPNIKARLQELIDKQRNLTPNDKEIIKKHNDYLYKKTEELIKAG
jgi:hypothetical protein